MKTCTKCGVAKPLEDFYKRPSCKHGVSSQCKPCEIEANRLWRSRPGVRDRLNELARQRTRDPEEIRRNRLWTLRRMKPEEFDAMLEAQGGRCAICRTPEPGGRGEWHVDHDHACCPGNRSCGKCNRGLLCSRCNPMIGMAKDDVDVLRAAVDYLTRTDNAAVSALGAIGQVGG